MQLRGQSFTWLAMMDSPSNMRGGRRSLRTPRQSTGRDPFQSSSGGREKSSSSSSSSLSPLNKDQDAGSRALPFRNEAPNYKNGTLKPNSKNEQRLQLLEKQLLEQQKLCENLRRQAQNEQNRFDEVKLKLDKASREHVRLCEENSWLHWKNEWAEKIENETSDLRGKLRQATEEWDSAVQLAKGLEVKVERLEQLMKNMEERAENQRELELEPEKTSLELKGKEGEIRQLQRQSAHQRPFRLGCSLAQYSYDPCNGPNGNPEAELPLSAGEYVYTCGGMSNYGFYLGELMDGRRGFVPSNLVKGVAGNGLFSFTPLEPSDMSDSSSHKPGFPCLSASIFEKSCSPDEDICVSLLSDGPERTPGEVHPPNLTLILNLRNITATSAEIAWFPSNGSCPHRVYLNEETYDVTEAGIDCYTFPYLTTGSQYRVKVEPLVPTETLVSPQGELQLKAAELTFTTPSAGPPDAPCDVQVEAGSSADILVISWLPVTIHPSGFSNGVQVTGYSVYISGEKVTEIMSPTAGSITIDVSRINTFQGPQTASVRTVSPFGESADSVPALIPSNLQKVLFTFLSQSVAPRVTCKEFCESEGSDNTVERRPEVCLPENFIFNFKPDMRAMSAYDTSAESSLETWDENSLHPEPCLSSKEVRKDPDGDMEWRKQMKQLCQKFAKLTMSPVESEGKKTLSTGSWLAFVADDSHRSFLSDIEEEEEEEQDSE